MRSRVVFLFCFSLSALHAHSPFALDQLRIELEDVKHSVRTTQVDLDLLSEKQQKTAALEKRLTQLEKNLEKATHDLAQILAKLQNLETTTSSHEKRLDDVVKLKGTLTALAQAIGQKTASATGKTHTVRAGDSLEKIARTHHLSVATLKKLNKLSGDHIAIGQELKLDE